MHEDMTINKALVEELLAEKGWSWYRLSQEIGVNKQTIFRIVYGTTIPGPKVIFALARMWPEHGFDLFVPANGVARLPVTASAS